MATLPIYRPLNNQTKDIRLLRVLPPENEAVDDAAQATPPWFSSLTNIRCELIHTRLDSNETYEALSYTWGSDDNPVLIQVDGQDISVRRNLALALAAQRHLTKPRILWVDALCINQDDQHERNQQVKNTRDIYQQQQRALVWLGRHGEKWDSIVIRAVDLISKMGATPPKSTLPIPPPKTDEFYSYVSDVDYAPWVHEQRRSWVEMVKEDSEIAKQNKEWSNLMSEWDDLTEEIYSKGTRRQAKMTLQRLEELKQQGFSNLQDMLAPGQEDPGDKIMPPRNSPDTLSPEQTGRDTADMSECVGIGSNKKTRRNGTERVPQQIQSKGKYELIQDEVKEFEVWLENLEKPRTELDNAFNKKRKERPVPEPVCIKPEVIYSRIKYLIIKLENRLARLEELEESRHNLCHRVWCVWDKTRMNDAMEWERRLFEGSPTEDKIEGSLTEEACILTCLGNILTVPYWRRLWIVQEILLAPEIMLCFGDNRRTTVSWELFEQAQQSLFHIPDFWNLTPAISGHLKLISQSVAFQLAKKRSGQKIGWPLHELIVTTRRCLCMDPRDKIYGLLALANDYQEQNFTINYSQSLRDTYVTAMLWYRNKQPTGGDFPNLVDFSHSLQRTFLDHAEPHDNSILDMLATKSTSLPAEIFRPKATILGKVLPIERTIEWDIVDQEYAELIEKDTVSYMAKFLERPREYWERRELESQLVYLDSLTTRLDNFLASRVSTVNAPDLTESTGWHIGKNNLPQNTHSTEGTTFFLSTNGEFGVASISTREGDFLCRFGGSEMYAVLRYHNGMYRLVSRAVIPNQTSAQLEGHLPEDAAINLGKARKNQQVVLLDISTIQRLSIPLEFNAKHDR